MGKRGLRELREDQRGGEGADNLVYVGSVHGRHIIVRLVQCLGSFVYLIGCSCHWCWVVDGIAQRNGQAKILLDVLQVEIRLEVPL